MNSNKVPSFIIGILIVTMVTVIIISYSQNKLIRSSAKMVGHTQDVLYNTEQIVSLISENETAAKGYAITGNDEFMSAIQHSQQQLETVLQRLRKLISDNPEQSPKLDSLQYYINKRVTFSKSIIDTYQQNGNDAALGRIATGEGRFYTEKIKNLVDSIQDTENLLLLKRKAVNQSEHDQQQVQLLVALFILLILAGAFAYKVKIDTAKSREYETTLNELNKNLEQKVADRTAALEASQKKLEETFYRISDAFIALDKYWNYTFINKSASKLIQMKPEEVIGKNVWEIFPDAVGSKTYIAFHESMEKQQVIIQEDYYEPLNLWQENHIYPSPEGLSVFIYNITERKKAEQKILKANRLYLFISQVNQMLVRVTNEEQLFAEVCHIAITQGGFRMAWVGKIDKVSENVIPVAWAGEGSSYLTKIPSISTKDIPEGRGPVGTAIRTGKRIFFNDLESELNFFPWLKVAKEYNFRSVIAFPLKQSGFIIGSLCFYSEEKNFFDEQELLLLEEVTGDVCFALDNFEKENLRHQAELETIAERELSDSIINSLPGIFYLYTKDNLLLRWNRNFEEVTGYSSAEIENMNPAEFIETEQRTQVNKVIEQVYNDGHASIQANLQTKPGKKIPYYFTGRMVIYENQPCMLGIGIDFSELIMAQDEIKATTEQLHQLSQHLLDVREAERKRIGREIHDELGQQLTAIKMDITWIERKLPDEYDSMKEKLKGVADLLNSSNLSIRRILNELRPSLLDDYGIVEALQWLNKQFTEKTSTAIEFTASGNIQSIPEPLSTCVYRIYQEALTNIARYANASNVNTILTVTPDKLFFLIEDNGIGFNPEKIRHKNSFGLLGMRERILSLQGEFTLVSSPGNGTMITIELPIVNT